MSITVEVRGGNLEKAMRVLKKKIMMTGKLIVQMQQIIQIIY